MAKIKYNGEIFTKKIKYGNEIFTKFKYGGETFQLSEPIVGVPSFAIIENVDSEVYIYDLQGALIRQFDIAFSGNTSPYGITFFNDDGTDAFAITDTADDEVYIYDLQGNLIRQFNIAFSGNTNAVGITYFKDGETDAFAITDSGEVEVYIYDLQGVLIRQFDVAFSGNAVPIGITYFKDGETDAFAITDLGDEVYIYDLQGSLIRQFDIAFSGNTSPYGITFFNDDGTDAFAITDTADDEVYIYDLQGNLIRQFDVAFSGNTYPYGITYFEDTPQPIIVEFPLINAQMSRFYDELGYGNRQSITGTDFEVLFNDTYSSWETADIWDTLNESQWIKCIWKDTYYDITINNLDGVDITEATIGIGGVSRTGSGTQIIRISYTPISTGIITELWVIDTNHTDVRNYQADLLQLLTDAGLSTTIAVGDKIRLYAAKTGHNQFVVGVKGIE